MIFLPPGDPRLKQISQPVPEIQLTRPEIREVVETMLKVARGQQKNNKKPIMVGLAAPQIGILKRIILVDVKADGRGKVGSLHIYINPEITWVSKQKAEWYEGCYSTSRVCGIVSRPVSIKVKAFKLSYRFVNRLPIQFRQIEEKHTDYTARIFQHEIDHLNGKVFVDHITNPENLHWVKKSEFPLYRNKQAWRNWPKKCSFEKWAKIKNPSMST